ncbi:MAG: hypothetical protein LBQ49_02400 [Rickettsiales bacterium]|jgi:hypothetical protein|nr:hypothetical protein [Rickettsiales bacterium]
MNDKKVAFLVPIHPPHFKFGNDLRKTMLDLKLDERADLWFIFTNAEERREFGEYDDAVILPEKLRNFDNNGIINIKKFFGLNEIKDKYEYVIVLDAESRFIKNVGVRGLCENYFKNKTLYGNKTLPEGRRTIDNVKKSCRRFFAGHKDAGLLDNELYLWFNQPCIYKSSTLDEFFKVIDYKKNAANFKWEDFDYYIYMFYLMLYHGFGIEDIEIESNYGIYESSLDYIYFKSNKYEKIPILMCSPTTLPRFDNPNLFIICHCDRDQQWILRVTNIKIDNLLQKVEALDDNTAAELNNTKEEIRRLTAELNNTKEEIRRLKIPFKFLRHMIACLVPFRKLRKKIRGER